MDPHHRPPTALPTDWPTAAHCFTRGCRNWEDTPARPWHQWGRPLDACPARFDGHKLAFQLHARRGWGGMAFVPDHEAQESHGLLSASVSTAGSDGEAEKGGWYNVDRGHIKCLHDAGSRSSRSQRAVHDGDPKLETSRAKRNLNHWRDDPTVGPAHFRLPALYNYNGRPPSLRPLHAAFTVAHSLPPFYSFNTVLFSHTVIHCCLRHSFIAHVNCSRGGLCLSAFHPLRCPRQPKTLNHSPPFFLHSFLQQPCQQSN